MRSLFSLNKTKEKSKNLLDIDSHWESPRGRFRDLGKKLPLCHHCPPPDLRVHLYFSAKAKLSRKLSRVPTPTNEGEPGVGTTTGSSPSTHPHVVAWLRKHNAANIPQSSLSLLGLGLIHPFSKYTLRTVCVSGLRQGRKGSEGTLPLPLFSSFPACRILRLPKQRKLLTAEARPWEDPEAQREEPVSSTHQSCLSQRPLGGNQQQIKPPPVHHHALSLPLSPTLSSWLHPLGIK